MRNLLLIAVAMGMVTALTAQNAPCTILVPPGDATAGGTAWPGGVVPYTFDANTNGSQQSAALAAMAEWEAVANVDFVARTNESDYINIRNSSGNSSFVGRIGGRQDVNVASWGSRFVIVHELCHALGFWHEQQRPDRDTYVQINFQNIQSGAAFNFNIVAGSQAIGPYDFDSVMHYGTFFFSTNGQPTITVLPPNQGQQSSIGQRSGLSAGDIAGMVARYGSLVAAPQITSASPFTIPAFAGGPVTITGQRLDSLTDVRVSGVSVPYSPFSSTQISFTLPAGTTIGPKVVVVENAGGTSNGAGLNVIGNVPPVLEAPVGTITVAGFPFDYRVHSVPGEFCGLFVSPDLSPSVIPGVVTAEIGASFTTLFDLGLRVADASGTASFSVTLPVAASGTQVHFEAISYSLTGLQLPVATTQVASKSIF